MISTRSLAYIPGHTDVLYYNSISWDSHVDGPGQRVVLFLQGCEYCCPWCHSPHTQSTQPVLLFTEALCLGCMRCEKNCPEGVHSFSAGIHNIQRSKCSGCGLCVDLCPQSIEGASSGALTIVPKTASIHSLFRIMRPQLEYCRALTISGGEPLLQWGAVKKLLELCKALDIEIAIETTLTADEYAIRDLLPLVDLWLAGLRPLTGDNSHLNVPDESSTEQNLRLLPSQKVCIRYPLIPGYTDSAESLLRAVDIMEKSGVHHVELLEFNTKAGHYYQALGRHFAIKTVTPAMTLDQAAEIFRSKGLAVSTIQ